MIVGAGPRACPLMVLSGDCPIGERMTDNLQDILNSIPNRQLLRVEEVADLLVVTKMTIYRWYDEDKLKGIKINGVLRIYRQSVVETIQNGNGKKADHETVEEVERKLKESSVKSRRVISKGVEI